MMAMNLILPIHASASRGEKVGSRQTTDATYGDHEADGGDQSMEESPSSGARVRPECISDIYRTAVAKLPKIHFNFSNSGNNNKEEAVRILVAAEADSQAEVYREVQEMEFSEVMSESAKALRTEHMESSRARQHFITNSTGIGFLKSHKKSLHIKSKYEETPQLTQKESLTVKNPPTTPISDQKMPELQKEFYLNTEFEEQSYIPIVKRPLPPIPPI